MPIFVEHVGIISINDPYLNPRHEKNDTIYPNPRPKPNLTKYLKDTRKV